MSESRNEQLALKALQNIAHQLCRLADALEVKNAEEEERWEPTNYRQEVEDEQ
ncbi:hypothetical protein OAT93_01915 [bacterium]|nr:hypothetical protein [bacterium]